jgi:hypothetical protein
MLDNFKYSILSYIPFCYLTNKILIQEKNKLQKPMSQELFKTFCNINHLCNREISYNGTNYVCINRKKLALSLLYCKPVENLWYFISAYYYGGGNFKQLYVNETGNCFFEIDV